MRGHVAATGQQQEVMLLLVRTRRTCGLRHDVHCAAKDACTLPMHSSSMRLRQHSFTLAVLTCVFACSAPSRQPPNPLNVHASKKEPTIPGYATAMWKKKIGPRLEPLAPRAGAAPTIRAITMRGCSSVTHHNPYTPHPSRSTGPRRLLAWCIEDTAS